MQRELRHRRVRGDGRELPRGERQGGARAWRGFPPASCLGSTDPLSAHVTLAAMPQPPTRTTEMMADAIDCDDTRNDRPIYPSVLFGMWGSGG
jgi:hypothetical protein